MNRWNATHYGSYGFTNPSDTFTKVKSEIKIRSFNYLPKFSMDSNYNKEFLFYNKK